MRRAGAESAPDTTDSTSPPADPQRPLSANGRGLLRRRVGPVPMVAVAVAVAVLIVAGLAYRNWSVSSDSCTGSNCAAATANEEAAVGPTAAEPSPSASPAASASASTSISASASASRSSGANGGPAAPGSFPGAGNTGVPAGKSLKSSGSVRVTKAGTVIDGLDVKGDINVEADNVTIKNTRVTNGGYWGIIQRDGASGLKIVDSEVRGNGRDKLEYGVTNQGGMITIQRTEVSIVSNHISTTVGLVADNYLHSPKYFAGDHIDGIESTSGPSSGTLIVRHNTVIIDQDQTSCIALFQDFGLQHDVVIEGNLLAGGGYSLYGGAGKYGKSRNIRVVNNRFSRQVYGKGGNFGPVAHWDEDGPGNVWQGNTWLDSGEPVNP